MNVYVPYLNMFFINTKSKGLQHVFINNNHWILVQIHANTPRMKNLPNDTIQLLTKIINVEHLLYTYANVTK